MKPTTLLQATAFTFACFAAHPSHAGLIGVDNLHGFTTNDTLGGGSLFADFRSALTAQGHTLVPLTSFETADLAPLDAVFLKIGFGSAVYSTSSMAAIQAYAQRAVFASDTSLFRIPGAGADRPITFGDNQRLLQNIADYLAGGRGVFFGADAGSGALVSNFNALVAPFGVTYSGTGVDDTGRTVTGILTHPVTTGVSTLGVDFHLPFSVTQPSLDLTAGAGADNILAVYGAPIPEPGTALFGLALLGVIACRGRRRTSQPGGGPAR